MFLNIIFSHAVEASFLCILLHIIIKNILKQDHPFFTGNSELSINFWPKSFWSSRNCSTINLW